MGMCCCVFLCPPLCAGGSCLASLPTYCAPRLALHPAWLIVGILILLGGVVAYVDLTFKCQEATQHSLGWVPVNGTGVWVSNATDFSWDTDVYWPQPDKGHEGEVLVNFTKEDLGISEPWSWSLSPFAYSGSGCWSEGSGAHAGQGMLTALLLALGTALLVVAAVVKVVEKTCGTCCGRPFKTPAAAVTEEGSGAQPTGDPVDNA